VLIGETNADIRSADGIQGQRGKKGHPLNELELPANEINQKTP